MPLLPPNQQRQSTEGSSKHWRQWKEEGKKLKKTKGEARAEETSGGNGDNWRSDTAAKCAKYTQFIYSFIYFASAAVTVDSRHITASLSASWSRFSPPADFVNGHVSTNVVHGRSLATVRIHSVEYILRNVGDDDGGQQTAAESRDHISVEQQPNLQNILRLIIRLS